MGKDFSCTNRLTDDYGAAMTPGELGAYLGLDPRTVKKYADRWGGVEVAPGVYRFFEKIVRERIENAHLYKPSRLLR